MRVPTTTVKKWGGSLAIVISADVAKRERLTAGTEVRYEVERARVTVGEFYGSLKKEFKGVPWKRIEKELGKGWDDE